MSVLIGNNNIVTDGLILYLDAANVSSYSGTGTIWKDLSGNSGNAILQNGTSFSTVKSGAMIFDGSNDYVDTGALLPYTAYTKTVWFYTSNFSAGNNLISGGDSNPNAQHFLWLGGVNRLTAGHNTSYYLIQSSTTLLANTWYFGAVTFSSSTGWVLYLNGVQEATNGSTTTFTGGRNVLLGCFNLGGTVLQGGIAVASVYNRVLTGAEILQNYNVLKSRFI